MREMQEMPERQEMHIFSFEEVLARDGRLVYSNVGSSMRPLIRQGRDLMVIEPVKGRLKRLDVPLYRRGSGQYVLHRIISVKPDSYVICGDNCWKPEYGISDRQVIGVLTAVVRDGKIVPVTDLRLRLYAHLWCDFFPLRAFILRTLRFLKRRIRRRIPRKGFHGKKP